MNAAMPHRKAPVPANGISQAFVLLRGRRVILDADLASLHGVTTKCLNEAVKRNAGRFPSDFIFLPDA
jgi:ORF6N domain-containing protein